MRCDLCGTVVPYTPRNIVVGYPVPAVACPTCREPFEVWHNSPPFNWDTVSRKVEEAKVLPEEEGS